MADAGEGRRWQAENMTIAIYLQLGILAIIDSTSIGTLLIPLWLLLRPDARRILPRILLYLGVLATFYFAVGIAVLSGADWVVSGWGRQSLTHMPVVQWAMVLGGGGMLAYSLKPDPARKAQKKTAAGGAPGVDAAAGHDGTAGMAGTEKPVASSPVEAKWQVRLSKALGSPGGIIGLAVIAGLLELPTMLPYLVAIGFLSKSTLALPAEICILAIYCLVMLFPALLLLALRTTLGHRLDPLIQRVSNKLGKFAGETLLWIVGIVGFLLLRAGLAELAPMAAWNPFK